MIFIHIDIVVFFINIAVVKLNLSLLSNPFYSCCRCLSQHKLKFWIIKIRCGMVAVGVDS